MEFIHQPYQPEDTIAALATPPGEGGVAIIRISGKEAVKVAATCFSGPVSQYKTHTAHYGQIINHQGEVVDNVLLMPMLGRRSYTGEDTVEIYCHGGSLISRKVLETVLRAGARHAMPGEFTFKAYINGRIDLAQAEAVQTLIAAKNERALSAAEVQLRGGLSEKIADFKEKLTTIAAILEAWVDFPDEGLEFASIEEVVSDLEAAIHQMEKLSATFHEGKMIHEGLSLCLIGCPNVGKSSLMNALLEKERAIVSPIAGTTRDILEDFMLLNGLNFRLLDTAGIHKTEELIEMEGIKRSKAALAEADLVLFVLDASRGFRNEDQDLLNQLPKEKTIAVWNKTDLNEFTPPALALEHVVQVSALKKMGLEVLKKKIDEVIWKNGAPPKEEVILTNFRHKEALGQAIESIQAVNYGLKNQVSPEFLALDMRASLQALGKIIGSNVGEDILSAIFSKFCIGK